MKRDYLLKLLENYTPTETEEQFKKDTIQFVKDHEDCFERELLKGHITASAWILNKDKTKALLLHHTKLDRWFQLGGHCDGDPHVLAVALKEAQEESGIDHIVPISEELFDIDIHFIPESKGIPGHYHYDMRFLVHAAEDDTLVQNRESKELRWIGKDRSELPTDALSVTRMFDKWLEL